MQKQNHHQFRVTRVIRFLRQEQPVGSDMDTRFTRPTQAKHNDFFCFFIQKTSNKTKTISVTVERGINGESSLENREFFSHLGKFTCSGLVQQKTVKLEGENQFVFC